MAWGVGHAAPSRSYPKQTMVAGAIIWLPRAAAQAIPAGALKTEVEAADTGEEGAKRQPAQRVLSTG